MTRCNILATGTSESENKKILKRKVIQKLSHVTEEEKAPDKSNNIIGSLRSINDGRKNLHLIEMDSKPIEADTKHRQLNSAENSNFEALCCSGEVDLNSSSGDQERTHNNDISCKDKLEPYLSDDEDSEGSISKKRKLKKRRRHHLVNRRLGNRSSSSSSSSSYIQNAGSRRTEGISPTPRIFRFRKRKFKRRRHENDRWIE